MELRNKINSSILKENLRNKQEKRITVSFYKYHKLVNPQIFRDHLYTLLDNLNVFGRIYVAKEGINTQISVPEVNYAAFLSILDEIIFLKGVRLNQAVEDNGKSFYKLKIKVRKKILADGLDDDTFDVTRIGKHVNATEFNELAGRPDSIVVDMRNHYESEIGHFKNALLPDADTFRDALDIVTRKLDQHRDKHILMYCTGGIRCEKASAYFKYIGFDNVYQLEGGIIKYARDVKDHDLENKYIGKNFVFDERLGEKISDEIIARCHQCGRPCDTHTNCKNAACNLLFIQCETCADKNTGCCSEECRQIIELPDEIQEKLRKGSDSNIRIYTKGRFPARKTRA